jgi:hypothetical protein
VLSHGKMLYLMTGASGAGKSACLEHLGRLVLDVALHDFDTIGVPENATPTWRLEADQLWLDRVLENQAQGRDTLLAGQTPLGELLACPRATQLDGIAACLIDCSDEARRRRLAGRSTSFGQAHYSWAAWMRGHAADPQWEPHVIREADPTLYWDRWAHWRRGDPRWSVRRLDTTDLTIEEAARQVTNWMRQQRRLHNERRGPLTGRWWDG